MALGDFFGQRIAWKNCLNPKKIAKSCHTCILTAAGSPKHEFGASFDALVFVRHKFLV